MEELTLAGEQGAEIELKKVETIDEYKVRISVGRDFEHFTKTQARELGEWLIKSSEEQ